MATELELLRTQLAALDSKMPSDVQSVRFEDQQITYQTVKEQIEAREYLRRRIRELENAAAGRTRYSVARFSCR